MEKVATDLHLHTLPRGDWTNFSWLLVRPGGNYLTACADVSEHLDEIEKLGGLSRVFLTDIHFANAWHGEAANHFGATLVCHNSDQPKVKARCKAAKLESIGERTQLDKEFLAVPTPGHADGGLCYLWTGAKQTVLFTGDFLCHAATGWAVFCGKAKRKTMAASLNTVGALPVTRICPGVSQGRPLATQVFAQGQWSKMVAETIAKFCDPAAK